MTTLDIGPGRRARAEFGGQHDRAALATTTPGQHSLLDRARWATFWNVGGSGLLPGPSCDCEIWGLR
jgi:hypothetical protein